MAYCKWPDKLRERLSNFRGISGGVLIKIRGVLKREAFILIIVTSLLKIYTPSVDTWRPSRDLYIALSNTSIDNRGLAQGYCVAIVKSILSLNLAFNTMKYATLVHRLNVLNDFAPLANSLYFGIFLLTGVPRLCVAFS